MQILMHKIFSTKW